MGQFIVGVSSVICIIFTTSYGDQVKARGVVKAIGPEMLLVDFHDVALTGEHMISIKQCVAKP
jgi:hypothetical protein